MPLPTDKWEERAGVKCCSYCGSIHPDDFMKAVEEGKPLGTTNKTYKAYMSGVGSGKFYFPHLSPEQIGTLVDLYNDKRIVFEGGFGFQPFPYFMVPA